MLTKSIRHRIRSFWDSKRSSAVHNLARHEYQLTKLHTVKTRSVIAMILIVTEEIVPINAGTLTTSKLLGSHL